MFKKLISKLKNSCEEDIERLNEENKMLKEKILEKQEQINKTNAYYKKKLRNLNTSKKHKS